MTRNSPRFLDEQPEPAAAPNATAPRPAGVLETPILLEPEPGAAETVGADWNPRYLAPNATPVGTASLALAGLAILFLSWLLLSTLASVIGLFGVSVGLGVLGAVLYAGGMGLCLCAATREWRSLRALHQVDALRTALHDPAAEVEATRALCSAWLTRLSPHLPEVARLSAALDEASDVAQMRSLLRNRIEPPLALAVGRIGVRAASEGSALVALSPHASWDGVIVGLRGVGVLRQVAQLYGLRPGPSVMLALLRRVSRAAVETATTDLLSQTAADHFLGNVPVLKHLAAAIPGASVAAIRLYRLAAIAARACSPVRD